MLSTTDPLQIQGHIQTESAGMEKDIPCKWNSKKAGVAISISDKIEVYSNTILPQETRNNSEKQPNLTSKTIRERRTKKPQSQQKEGNHKNQIRNK